MWRLWMSQSCFSLGFLSLEALNISWVWEVFILEWEWNAKSQVFQNRAGWRLGLVTWLSREFKPRANRIVRLDFLSCSAPTSVTIHLLSMLHSCASSGGLLPVSHLWVPIASPCYFAQSWAFLHTLLLHDSHLNTGLLIANLQANLARNKANKMVD